MGLETNLKGAQRELNGSTKGNIKGPEQGLEGAPLRPDYSSNWAQRGRGGSDGARMRLELGSNLELGLNDARVWL
jgi:hypothetical protein